MPLRRNRYDLVVLGGGTGGIVASLIAARAGARVALVERDRIGGDCLTTDTVWQLRELPERLVVLGEDRSAASSARHSPAWAPG